MADKQADPSATALGSGRRGTATATSTSAQTEVVGDIETIIAQSEVEVDVEETRSNFDSALGDSDVSTLSTSLKSSIFNYRYENGRRYHGYKDGSYLNPDDEDEQERLDILHHLFRMMLEGKLFTAPVSSNMQRILDVGTGTGIWAIDVADEFPAANVIGTDISPIQPTWVPPNCSFYIEDAESEWLFDEPFDFIHGRALCGSISDWPKFFGQVKDALKPGGWIELQDYVSWIKADDDTLERGRWTHEWVREINRGTEMFGKSLDVVEKYAQWMSDAGFVDVRDEIIKVPIGSWAKDPKLKEMGKIEQVQMVSAAESFTLALYTRVLGYSEDQTRVIIEAVKSEFMDKKNHWYIVYHFVSGRKPES